MRSDVFNHLILKVFYCVEQKVSVCRKCHCKSECTHVDVEDALEDTKRLWNRVNWTNSNFSKRVDEGYDNIRRQIVSGFLVFEL